MEHVGRTIGGTDEGADLKLILVLYLQTDLIYMSENMGTVTGPWKVTYRGV